MVFLHRHGRTPATAATGTRVVLLRGTLAFSTCGRLRLLGPRRCEALRGNKGWAESKALYMFKIDYVSI